MKIEVSFGANKRLLLFTLYLLAFSACETKKSRQPETTPAPPPDFYTLIQSHFNKIDSFLHIDYEVVMAENLKLQETLKQHSAIIFSLKDTTDYDLLYITKS